MPLRSKLPSALSALRKQAFWDAVGKCDGGSQGSATQATEYSGRRVEVCVIAYRRRGSYGSTARWSIDGRFCPETRLNERLGWL